MITEIHPLRGQRQKGESDSAVIACNDWLRLGTGRTLPELLLKYSESYQDLPPTQSLPTLKDWSAKFAWNERAVEFDADYEAIKNAERLAVMSYGASLDYERVRKLKRLADLLEKQIYELSTPDDSGISTYLNIWLPDVKQIGTGKDAERVDIERFNAQLIEQYRSVLDDIAKEVGHRRQKTELGNLDGATLAIRIINSDDD